MTTNTTPISAQGNANGDTKTANLTTTAKTLPPPGQQRIPPTVSSNNTRRRRVKRSNSKLVKKLAELERMEADCSDSDSNIASFQDNIQAQAHMFNRAL